MLRIQRSDVNADTVTLALQGRIIAEWADLLERECAELMRTRSHVTLDLSGVIFISHVGIEALGRLDRAGARIAGCTPLFTAMLEQEGIAVHRPTSPSHPLHTVRTRKEKS